MFAVFVLRVLGLSTERSQRHLLKMLKYNLIVQTPSNSFSNRVRTHTLFTFIKTVFRLAMAASSDFHSSRSDQLNSFSVYSDERYTCTRENWEMHCTAQGRREVGHV